MTSSGSLRRLDEVDAGSVPRTPTLTADGVVAAASLVREGVVYDLARVRFPGMPLPAMHPPLMVLPYRTPHGLRVQPSEAWPSGSDNNVEMSFTSEVVTTCLHTGAHIDAAGHMAVGNPAEFYGGTEVEGVGDFGLRTSDAGQLTPIVTRGILLDLTRLHGGRPLPAGASITAADIEAVLTAQQTDLKPGDAVLLRTGYGGVWPDRESMSAHAGAGLTVDGARWLVQAGVCAVGADTEAVEQLPSEVDGNPHPVHDLLLRQHGMPMLEMLALEQLAADSRWEFLFVATPVKIRGATAGITDPIAVV